MITDNFEDGVLDADDLAPDRDGTGIDIAERNGRLEIEFAADGVPGGEFNVLGAHYGTGAASRATSTSASTTSAARLAGGERRLVRLNAWFTGRPQLAIARQSQTWGEEYILLGRHDEQPAGRAIPAARCESNEWARGSRRIRRGGSSGFHWLGLLRGRADDLDSG